MKIDCKMTLLHALHRQIVRYIAFNTIGIAFYLINGAGYFWPIWVLLLWGADLLYQAYQLNLLKSAEVYTDNVIAVTKKWKKQHEKIVQSDEQNKKNTQ